jgi:PAS domain S-box-containing protein
VPKLALVHPEDRARFRQSVEDYLGRRLDSLRVELRLRGGRGDFRWVAIQGAGHWDDENRPRRLVGTLEDVTDGKLVEEERDRLFNLSVDLLGIVGFDGFLRQANPAWVRVLGWSRNDLMSRPLHEFVHVEDRGADALAMRELEAGEPVRGLEVRFRCRDGGHRWLSWNSFPLPDRRLIFSVVRDVTERRTFEQKLVQYQDRLRSLSSQLSRVEERQRRQLAAALHDGLAQDLFAIRTQVALLRRPERLTDPAATIDAALAQLEAAIAQTRHLTFELVPPALHEVGLPAALEWLADSFAERAGVACSVAESGPAVELAEDERTMFFQSVRELLNNVSRHAGARHSSVRVERTNHRYRVIVEDDGCGFEVDAGGERPAGDDGAEVGFGLFSIRERFRAQGGALRIESNPRHGCRVTLELPLVTEQAS